MSELGQGSPFSYWCCMSKWNLRSLINNWAERKCVKCFRQHMRPRDNGQVGLRWDPTTETKLNMLWFKVVSKIEWITRMKRNK